MSTPGSSASEFAFDLGSFRRYLLALGRAQGTVRHYTGAVRHFYAYLEQKFEFLDACEITPDHVRGFIALKLETSSSASAYHHAQALRSYFGFLESEGAIDRSPAENVRSPRAKTEPAKVLELAEIRRMLRACRGGRFFDRRDLAMLRMFVSTGARCSEVANLKINPLDYGEGDVDLDHGTVRFIGKGGFGRSCSLDRDTVRAVERYLRMRSRHPKSHLPNLWLTGFGGITNNGMYVAIRRRAEIAGIKGFHLHRIRHTFAHEWLKTGGNEGDLMRVMGWRSREMVDYYAAGVAEERAIAAARKFSMSLGL